MQVLSIRVLFDVLQFLAPGNTVSFTVSCSGVFSLLPFPRLKHFIQIRHFNQSDRTIHSRKSNRLKTMTIMADHSTFVDLLILFANDWNVGQCAASKLARGNTYPGGFQY